MLNRHEPHSSLLRRKPMWPPLVWFVILGSLLLAVVVMGKIQADKDKAAIEATTFYGSTTPTASEDRHIL